MSSLMPFRPQKLDPSALPHRCIQNQACPDAAGHLVHLEPLGSENEVEMEVGGSRVPFETRRHQSFPDIVPEFNRWDVERQVIVSKCSSSRSSSWSLLWRPSTCS